MPVLEIKLTNRQTLAVPSASGIELVNGTLYAVGDNSPWLFQLDSQYNLLNRWVISGDEKEPELILTKKEKPDFEAMTALNFEGKKALLIFGSGSKLKHRSSLIFVSLGDSLVINTYDLESFYRNILDKGHWDKDNLNIEGAIVDKHFLYLLNRGNNHVIRVIKSEFLNYVLANGPMPALSFFSVKLPSLEGVEAGFSGGTISPDSTQIIFTASVENTSDWNNDGQILGSFVGLIQVNQLSEKQYSPASISIQNKQEVLKVKIESVIFKGFSDNNGMKLLMVTDSDGGDSEVFEIELSN